MMLDPRRFQNINAKFANAARFLVSKPSAHLENTSRLASRKPSYAKLKQFQEYREQLGLICTDLIQVLQVEGGYNVFPSVLEEEVRQLTQKVKSQKFRLAVVGEFSRGKSTFLNALLGEELQPVRTMPCSGALTVLKYGTEKRVVCHYKNGTQSVIPFDQYQQLASIPKEAAVGKRGFELPESSIAEIVLEHPGLELCRHGVEIVDSPGLNENSVRTAVTERLLQDADAAIFLTSAQHPLTQKEQDLLQNLKHLLQKGDSEVPVNNLFVLVNFMDMLRLPQDKSDVMERVKNIMRDPEVPLINDNNRVHFISAQAALDAILKKTTNEHSEPFEKFVNVLETFLVEERGRITLEQEVTSVQRFVSVTHNSLKQISNAFEGNLRLSTAEQHKTLERISAISGFDIKIQKLSENLLEESKIEINSSWKQWQCGLKTRLSKKSERWAIYQQDKEEVIKDYIEQFNKDISKDADKWLKENILKSIVEPKLDKLDSEIAKKLAMVKNALKSVDHSIDTSLYEQFELLSIAPIEFQSKFISGKRTTAFFKSVAVIANMLVVGLITRAIIDWFSGQDAEAKRYELKKQVIEKGVAQFAESSDKIVEKLIEDIKRAFDDRTEKFHRDANSSISILCNLLEQQKSIVKGKLEQKEVGTAIVRQKDLQIQAIKTALSRLTKTALS